MSHYKYFTIDHLGHVALICFSRPPHNYFNAKVIEELLAIFTHCDEQTNCRVTVLCAEGSVFCAGGEFGDGEAGSEEYATMASDLYNVAMRLFLIKKPMIVAIDGAAIGGGLGLALVADFRVASKKAKFSANFSRLGIHPGFGSSITMPRIVGEQTAKLLFFTGRRIDGEEAHRIGLVDVLAINESATECAMALAQEIAASAPMAVQETRATLRQGLAEQVANANRSELEIQSRHMQSEHFKEGVKAMAERRTPNFVDD